MDQDTVIILQSTLSIILFLLITKIIFFKKVKKQKTLYISRIDPRHESSLHQ